MRKAAAAGILVASLVACGGGGRPETVFDQARSVRLSQLPAYAGVPFADELKTEQDRFAGNLVEDSVTGTKAPDFSGRYTNVKDGRRRTGAPPACTGCRAARVWLVGGSSAFGLGQRDDHTIASELVRLASRDAFSLEVVNLAVPGWTVYRERLAIRQQLATGAPPPDAVVFYDGFNDVMGTVISSAVKGADEEAPTDLRTDDIIKFTEDRLSPARGGTAEDLGRLAAKKYRREQALALGELAPRGIEARFYFQPDAFASPRQYRSVARTLTKGVTDNWRFYDEALATASAALAGPVENLRGLYNGVGRPLYADLVHTNEEGARLAAEAVYRSLGPLLRERAGSASGAGR